MENRRRNEPKPEESEPVQDQSVQVAKNMDRADHQSVRLENEMLRRRIEDLLAQREEEMQARLVLKFQVLKLTSELKATTADLRAASGNRSTPERAPEEGAQPEVRTSPRGGDE